MKRAFWLILLFCFLPALLTAQIGIYQQGKIVRMHMGECIPIGHGFVATLGGPASPMGPELCPEYTLVSDKVVFVIVGGRQLLSSLWPRLSTSASARTNLRFELTMPNVSKVRHQGYGHAL